MSVRNDTINISIKLPLTRDEIVAFDRFLERRGAKKGPLIRQLILRALEEDESIRSTKTQIDEKVEKHEN
ncbi:MAG: hypothetical protein SAMD01599839_08350 [Rectinema sp.]